MADNKKPSPMIRLWTEHLETLEPLSKLGLNCAGVVNECLKDNLKQRVDRKIKELKSALAEV